GGRSRGAQGASGEDLTRGRDYANGAGIHFADAPQCHHLSRQGFCGPANFSSPYHHLIRADMQNPERLTAPYVRPIHNLRWWIGGLLFASTVINYIDRQTLSLLSPYLKQLYHWTNSDYATLLIGLRIAYSVRSTLCVRVMD